MREFDTGAPEKLSAEIHSPERREAIKQGGAGLFWFCLGGWAVAALQQVFPNFLYTASLAFTIGAPGEFLLGVSGRFFKSHRVWIVRDAGGFYALWAQCPHLAGEVAWDAAHVRFECPSHGSCFAGGGERLSGPAERGLSRCALGMDAEGRIRVDKALLSSNPAEWNNAPYYLSYHAAE